MESLDIETMEQIKGIVNDAKNKKAPLEKSKRIKKVKETKKGARTTTTRTRATTTITIRARASYNKARTKAGKA